MKYLQAELVFATSYQGGGNIRVNKVSSNNYYVDVFSVTGKVIVTHCFNGPIEVDDYLETVFGIRNTAPKF